MSSILRVGLVLLLAWAALWLVFKVVGWMVHLLLLAAVIFIVWSLVKKGWRRVR